MPGGARAFQPAPGVRRLATAAPRPREWLGKPRSFRLRSIHQIRCLVLIQPGATDMSSNHRPSRRVLQASLVIAATTVAACGGGGTSPSVPVSPATAASVPVLSVPAVDLTLLYDFKPFGLPEGSGHINPTYVLYTVGDTTSVRAAGPGTVVNILANPAPSTDSEIHIRPSGAPDYLIVYDHIVSLRVGMGESVTAGQILGRIGPWVSGLGFTELQVNRGSGQGALALCPRDFGTADFNSAHDAALARFPARGASVCLTSSVQP